MLLLLLLCPGCAPVPARLGRKGECCSWAQQCCHDLPAHTAPPTCNSLKPSQSFHIVSLKVLLLLPRHPADMLSDTGPWQSPQAPAAALCWGDNCPFIPSLFSLSW